MSWRTIVVQSHVKLSYKNGYMISRGEDVRMVHLSEINTVIIDSTQVSLTSYLLCELVKRKIKVIFCDEKRNPCSELMSYYGAYNSSKKIRKQIQWDMEYAKEIWTYIVKQKILNQAEMLSKYGFEANIKLMKYAEEIEPFDMTNREAHAAKVYFNSLFGKEFSRDDVNSINAALNYGYGILLSNFNKEIVSDGYLTQLGIKHFVKIYLNSICNIILTPTIINPLIQNIYKLHLIIRIKCFIYVIKYNFVHQNSEWFH